MDCDNCNISSKDPDVTGDLIGTFTRTTTFYKWMTLKVNNASLFAVNRTGHTQFRVRFTIDDSNDAIKDLLRFLSGDYYYAAGRPRLIITYYIP